MSKRNNHTDTHKGPASPPKERLHEVHMGTITQAVSSHEHAHRRMHLCIVLLFLIVITVLAF
jgi:hypothetical protein